MTDFNDRRVVMSPQLVIGAFITLFGVVLTLDQLGVVPAGRLFPIWPLLILTVGVLLLISRSDRRGRFWGITWTFVGGWMLLNTLGWVRASVGDMLVPVIFLLVGGSILSRAWRRGPMDQRGQAEVSMPGFVRTSGGTETAQASPDGRVTLFAVMAESRRASKDNPFRGAEMTAIMGGCHLDLRQATIAPGETAEVNVLAIMAGHEIWVPAGWAVAIEVTPVLGGVDDKRLPTVEPPPASQPVLRLRGLALMGSVVIKN